MNHRTLRGKILYTSKKPEQVDAERGREYFTLTQQADGTDVLLAHCEIDDAPNVVRDVCLSLHHSDARPIDCSVRLSVGDRFEGSGWMRFTETYAECETHNRRDGRLHQRLDLQRPVRWLQAHPIAGDALLMRLYDLARGPGKQMQSDLLLTSPDHRGATGPQLFPAGFGIVYIGEEEITVGAGTFAARHFQVTDTAGSLPEEHPPYDIWCSADDDYLLLRAGAGGYMQTHYELVELERG
ncbi:DUF3108 domain-containing protein [Exilibacterium tricleocarpae]|uniref:DUF3108 domain-containing protein n=1 Tax=Exilibacterium tricleocarpae TaxID=2591008 RepID=A0A545TVJ6_9GAMM|nr:DUF3108 domain-containing protein [Exilibacterium tricleocarpae]TQV81233.1 DUF3108 domain-containing protein [Exilibacterium tricleocarpae]